MAIPTDTWNSDKRSKRPSGSSGARRIGERQEFGADFHPALRERSGDSVHRLTSSMAWDL